LDKAIKEPNYRKLLEEEPMALTSIGNNFMIRHTETTKTEIKGPARVDYLFQRMLAMTRLLRKTTDRGG